MNIIDVWYRLEGPKLRGQRGIAWWRGGQGYNVHLFPNAQKRQFKDYTTDEWGDCAKLVMLVKDCTYPKALDWLGEEVPNFREDPDWAASQDWKRGILHSLDEQFGPLDGTLQRKRINRFIVLRNYYAELPAVCIRDEFRASRILDPIQTRLLVGLGREVAQSEVRSKADIHEFVQEFMPVEERLAS